MHITLIHPAMGHRHGERYIRAWQMESLPMAALAGLTPQGVQVSFFDDRMETLPKTGDTDAVALSVETYTARRAYAIAEQYRNKGIPVIMGGFHATLLPNEVALHADAVVIGEVEGIWSEVVDDLRHRTLKSVYQAENPPDLSSVRIDRSIFRGKNYLPISLVETGRGCAYSCEFCAVASFFKSRRRSRPTASVIEEIRKEKRGTRLFFFVDDNFASERESALELMRALRAEKIKWVTQMSLPEAMDEAFLRLMRESGCTAVLVGLESLNERNLDQMNKSFNIHVRQQALANLRKQGIAVYGTFVFGYDEDTQESFRSAVDFAVEQELFIAAFNHMTPFPGTPLYSRLSREGRLRYDSWWLDDAYRYNDLPFFPKKLTPEEVTAGCTDARRRFYSFGSIFRRQFSSANANDLFKLKNYLAINLMHRLDISARNAYPIGQGRSEESA